MTKTFCDRCGAETSGNICKIFEPDQFAPSNDDARDRRRGHLWDVCKNCESQAKTLFAAFMSVTRHCVIKKSPLAE
jgi:hypothetical protein